MSDAWRILIDDQADGAWNMAVDRSIQLAREAGVAPPTLRVYAWSRPTLTLGRFQEAELSLIDRCARSGLDVARRPTGGRGVVHDDEVTYAVVVSTSDGVPSGVSASYRYLCAGIVEAYRQLGVSAELTARDRGERHTSACYLHATAADVSVGVAKLSGSAQVWHGETCLQHGSFTRTRDMEREREVFGLSDEESDHLRHTTTTLADLLGDAPERDRVVQAVATGFSLALGFRTVPGVLSDAERRVAEELVSEYRVASAGAGSS